MAAFPCVCLYLYCMMWRVFCCEGYMWRVCVCVCVAALFHSPRSLSVQFVVYERLRWGSKCHIYAFVFPFTQPFNLWMSDANNVFNSFTLIHTFLWAFVCPSVCVCVCVCVLYFLSSYFALFEGCWISQPKPHCCPSIWALLIWIPFLFMHFSFKLDNICIFVLSSIRTFARLPDQPCTPLSLSHSLSLLQRALLDYKCTQYEQYVFIEHISLRFVQKRNYPLFWHFPGHVTQCFVVGLHVVVKMREKKSKIKYQAIIYIIRALSGIHKSRQNGNIWFKAPRGWSVSKTDRECSAQTINAIIVNDEIKFLHKSP